MIVKELAGIRVRDSPFISKYGERLCLNSPYRRADQVLNFFALIMLYLTLSINLKYVKCLIGYLALKIEVLNFVFLH